MSTIDDILLHLGPWHYPVLVFCFFRGFPAAYYAMSLSFTAPSLRHWCARPPQLANWTTERWLLEAVPPTHVNEKTMPSQCDTYSIEVLVNGTVSILNDSTVRCSSWEYDLGDNTNTMTNDVRQEEGSCFHDPAAPPGERRDVPLHELPHAQRRQTRGISGPRRHPQHHVHHVDGSAVGPPPGPGFAHLHRWLDDRAADHDGTRVALSGLDALPGRHHDRCARQCRQLVDKLSSKPTFTDLFRSRSIRITSCLLSSKSVLDTLVYYNLTYSSILLGDPYLSFALVAAAEYPGRLLGVVAVNYFRRRTAYIGLYVFASICSAVAIFVPADASWALMASALLAKMGLIAAHCVNVVQMSELYPTRLRTTAMGFTITTSRVGAILAPFTKELGVVFFPWVPKVVDITVCACLILVSLPLPETFKEPLPDTLHDIKKAKKSRKGKDPVDSYVAAEAQPLR
ncbi:solute carrier family 22 member 6-like isoform X4 [Dermacentor variabilis]|uniref:solute carrier family 22 member 6-like isoform X4 n=1 Tax=Dermacentor variabilis TaxID=34621 RepID=UPI003F5B0AE9